MGFRVLKFGGSSVADATAMSRVLDIVGGELAKGRVVLVSSAISGCTDGLLAAAAGDAAGIPALRERHKAIVRRLFTGDERADAAAEATRLFASMEAAPADEKVTFGELLSTRILAGKLSCEGVRVLWVDSRQLVVKDDLPETYRRIREALADTDADVVVAPGFICSDSTGKVCTLGRGGSDYSAALYAAALAADSLQIWTDVPGIMTANPKQVSAARTIPGMSYRAALEMAEHGAKVLYAPTVAPAMEAGIDIEIRNTFAPDGRFTRISAQPDSSPWVGIASTGGEICLVGTVEADFSEAAGLVRETLRTAGIAPLAVRVNGTDILVSVREAIGLPALQVLHRAFFETRPLREVNLFIAGFGAVGKALAGMVGRTAATVAERTGKTLRVAGLADSRRYRIDLGGVASLDGAVAGDFVDAVIDLAPKGSVFVDCTDSETLYKRYPDLFRAGLHIVSSNRRSFAVPYVEYAAMQAAARENGRFFRYETTVGAALPMLESLAIGANSCDEIVSLEAVVSCTLNQILSAYGEGPTFASLVRAAQEAGLTEPDPRLDLGGRDALRKLLILAREAGVQLEEQDVVVEPLIPASLFGVSLDEFYRGLTALEPAFAEAHRRALAAGCRRRFVAFLEKKDDLSPQAAPPLISTKAERPCGEISTGYRAGIRVQDVPETHPAYHLRGTENAILIRSAFHPTPIVIQGPGEGARQAAASLLNDILR
jgi:aspartate kinase